MTKTMTSLNELTEKTMEIMTTKSLNKKEMKINNKVMEIATVIV